MSGCISGQSFQGQEGKFIGISPLLVKVYSMGRLTLLVFASLEVASCPSQTSLAAHPSGALEESWMGGKRGMMCPWAT